MARSTDTIFNTTGTTASFNSSDFDPSVNYKGAMFYLTATENSGTATVDVKIQRKDLDGNYFDIGGGAFAQVSATGTSQLIIYPGIAETANETVSDVLSDVFRAVVTVGGTGDYDLKLVAEYLD